MPSNKDMPLERMIPLTVMSKICSLHLFTFFTYTKFYPISVLCKISWRTVFVIFFITHSSSSNALGLLFIEVWQAIFPTIIIQLSTYGLNLNHCQVSYFISHMFGIACRNWGLICFVYFKSRIFVRHFKEFGLLGFSEIPWLDCWTFILIALWKKIGLARKF